MTRICLLLICLAVCTYTTYAFVGFENERRGSAVDLKAIISECGRGGKHPPMRDLIMLQMMSGMLGGQRGANPSQAPGGGAELGIPGQPSNTRRGDDFGLGSLMQMRLMSALMN